MIMNGPRHRLASLEAEFLRSLSTGGPYPSGSDLRGMRATSQILWTKRVRTMARAWPELAQLFGKSLNAHATELLAGTALPPGDHAVQDGLMLARHLEAAGSIPDGFYANPSAYAAPAPGQWGNAGRNSIIGPAQFAFDAGIGARFALRIGGKTGPASGQPFDAGRQEPGGSMWPSWTSMVIWS